MRESKNQPEVSVVIVNWNGGHTILACLRSLFSFPPTCDWAVVVVDNASADGEPGRAPPPLPPPR